MSSPAERQVAHDAPAEEAPRFHTVAEVAAILRETEQTTLRRIRQGRLPAVRDGRRYLIPAQVIADLHGMAAAAVATSRIVEARAWFAPAGCGPSSVVPS